MGNFFKRYISWMAPLVLAAFLLFGFLLASTPPPLPHEQIVEITQGMSAPQIAQKLSDKHIIAHPFFLRLALRVLKGSGDVQAGAYRFDTPQDLVVVTYRLLRGAYGLPPTRITFIEGVTVREAAAQVAAALPGVSIADVMKEALPYEGYLFPDTYFFTPSATAASITAMMRSNFNTKIAPFIDDISASNHSLSDIVIVASLVEKEARTSANRRIVAGILWNRLALGMPLQVDAVFGYIFNRDTYSPSAADLQVDSPYNTYKHTGLPPTPIDNPGVDALDAAIHPTKTNYLYYLTGKDDQMHYATTYAGHQFNQRKYLP